jgi:hypothetical protein
MRILFDGYHESALYNFGAISRCIFPGTSAMKIPNRIAFILLTLVMGLSAAAQNAPIIDNERVTVWDTTTTLPPAKHDFIAVSLTKKGTAILGHKGDISGEPGARTVVIELKDRAEAPLANTSGYPNAFPRPHVVKLLENDKVIVWSYRWNPGEPTPMHFHDKDVVVVYEDDTALKSTTPDGKSVMSEHKFGDVRFNHGNRTHSELLVKDTGSAVMTEFK